MSHLTVVDAASRDAAACCGPLTSEIVEEDSADLLARTFKAQGDPTRVRLLSLVAAAPEDGACICDLTEPVGLSQPTVSHHMKLLVDAGLLAREQRGRWAYFTVVQPALDRLARVLGHAE